jgi:hypothetical protein
VIDIASEGTVFEAVATEGTFRDAAGVLDHRQLLKLFGILLPPERAGIGEINHSLCGRPGWLQETLQRALTEVVAELMTSFPCGAEDFRDAPAWLRELALRLVIGESAMVIEPSEHHFSAARMLSNRSVQAFVIAPWEVAIPAPVSLVRCSGCMG